MKIRVKKLNDNAIIPTRGSEFSAGLDLYSSNETSETIEPGESKKFPTGIAMEIPEGYFGGVYARSGLATKQGLRPANCVGVVDSDYRGDITVVLHNDSNETRTISSHERIAQLIIQPYPDVELEEVEDLDSTDRGENGFGSTGSN